MNYLERINSFNENTLLSLDEVVIWALELFEKVDLSSLDISEFKKPLIAGSWNAIITAKIIFSWIDALFCDETTFDDYLQKDIDWLIIVSASWEKHAIIFANKAISKWIKTKLLTCNSKSSTWKIIWVQNTTITHKNREPYTYNTSTYIWWVFALTQENPTIIKKFIQEKIDPILNNINFSEYEWYLLITPNKFSAVNQLLIVKFIELFGRKIARDVFSYEHLKHAISVVPHDKELTITFWEWELFMKPTNYINIPLPKDCNIWWMMSISYYIIWKIQNSYPQYFKENISKYIEYVNKTEFWKWLSVIVE